MRAVVVEHKARPQVGRVVVYPTTVHVVHSVSVFFPQVGGLLDPLPAALAQERTVDYPVEQTSTLGVNDI